MQWNLNHIFVEPRLYFAEHFLLQTPSVGQYKCVYYSFGQCRLFYRYFLQSTKKIQFFALNIKVNVSYVPLFPIQMATLHKLFLIFLLLGVSIVFFYLDN